MTSGSRHICFTGFLALLALAWLVGPVFSRAVAAAAVNDDTLLMFVGQPLSVVTTASRRPESPTSAPAVVDVVTRQTIARRGYRTLGELLSFESGFYTAGEARGSVPYLRGLPGSVLFLYNGIPMPAGGTKSVYPLDQELSLDNVRQVEIIRGPGSVLWGSDAFAGIVNVVSLGPDDLDGPSLSVSGGSHGERNVWAGTSLSGGPGAVFLSAAKTKLQYHDSDYNTYEMGPTGAIEATPHELDDSGFVELTATGNISDWLTFTGRFSEFTRKYAVENETGLKWNGTRKTPVSHLGLSAHTTYGRSHLVFSTYYQNQSITLTDMNTSFGETLDQFHGELLMDRSFAHSGILTLGASFRENMITGAQAGAGFNPGAVLTPFPVFTQAVDQRSYNTRVSSGFVQYRHHLGDLSLWAGARVENHSDFSTHFPWNAGAAWDDGGPWRFKALLGRAYQTPYSQQIIQGIDEEPGVIDTLSLQAAWQSADIFELDLTGFCSRVSGVVIQDPYAGISGPAKHDIYGVELAVRAMLKNTRFFVNLSALQFNGDTYPLKVEDFSLVNPDGSMTVFYEHWDRPFDTAPDLMLKAGLFRRITDRIGLSVTGTYTAAIPYSFSKNTVSGRYPDYWRFNTAVSVKDLLLDRAFLRFGLKNILDTAYTTGGHYGPVPGPGRTFFVEWGMTW
jgi:outer membrane cobalamin receptor